MGPLSANSFTINPTSLPYWHLTWVNAIVNDIHWSCAHLLPLLAIWFPVLEEDILLMVQPNPPAIHLKYISDHTAGICLLSRQVTNADLKVQYIDKPLSSTLLLNRGKRRSLAFIQDFNPIKRFKKEHSVHISHRYTAVLLNWILVVTSITPIAMINLHST